MNARKLHSVGFLPLIPLRPKTKIPAIKGWSQRGAATIEEVQQWDAQGKNTGILARDYPGIDIDIDDSQLTAGVVKLARDMLGNAPIRIRGPRALMMYRTQNPFPKIKLYLEQDGVEHAVEVLGDGQQYLIDGVHPSGDAYTWHPEPLWQTAGPDDLTWVAKSDVEKFLVKLTEELEDEGWTVRVGSAAEREHAPDQESLHAPSMAQLEKAVMMVPNRGAYDSRDEWLKMMAAIKGAGAADPGAALDLAIKWSRTWNGADDATDANTRAAFESFGEVALGWNWIRDEAKAGGFDDAALVFDVAPEPPAGSAPPPPPGNSFVIDGVITYSDVWKVRMILPELEDVLRYASGVWYTWQGNQWRHDTLGAHRMLVEDLLARVAVRVRAYAQTLTGSMQDKTMTVAKGLQGKTAIENTIQLLQPRLAMNRDDFDQNLLALGVPDGQVDLTTGEVSPGEPTDLISRSTNVTPRPGPSPMFEAFMRHLTDGDPELCGFLQRYAGYALTGRMEEKVFLYGFGSDSDTGKSTFIHILQGVMGEYAKTVDIETFINTGKGDTGYTLAQLPGIRLVTATEPKRGQTWDEKTIKTITGGDEVQVRAIYGHPFTFQPQFKLLIAGNAEPSLRTVDDAMLRRVLIVPMNQKVLPEERIDNLAEMIIEDEGAQVLHWMVQGAQAWAQDGLQLPAKVADATRAYGEAEDAIGEWIEDHCELGMDGLAPSVELFTSWSQWCRARNMDPGSNKSFTQELKARGFEYGRTSSIRGFAGIRVRPRVSIGTEES